MVTINIPQPLLDEVSRGRASLLLGAGASRDAGFPDSRTLADHLVAKSGSAGDPLVEDQPLDAVVQHLYYKDGYGTEWVRRCIIELFDGLHRKVPRPPSPGHGSMVTIPWRTLFTTNYDRLVEIVYESNPNSVQRVLPIYAPDPLLHRHDPNQLRLVKLNGSVDEAARNSAHTLVLTFAEQQDAVTRNRQFYDLLKEEAINGPIVFIGFGFVHPGASASGTSPEFLQLRDMLREMGRAARWHYCVTPDNPDDPITRNAIDALRANQIAVIPATFADFMHAISERLVGPPIALESRPAIVIPVGEHSIQIQAQEYEADARHLTTLGTYIEDMIPPPVEESLNGGATWASFKARHAIPRLCKNDFKQVLSNSARNSPEILFLGAPPGWGKTFLLQDVAVDLYQAGTPVLWLNPLASVDIEGATGAPVTISMWDSARIDYLLGQIENAAPRNPNPNAPVPLIIADNCPERANEVLALFRTLADNRHSFVLIFSARDNEFESLVHDHTLLRRARKFRPSVDYDSRQEVRDLIDFCERHRVAAVGDASHRQQIAQTIISEEADAALILALQVIFDHEHRPFSQIVRGWWQSLASDIARTLVRRVATLHRFGSTFSPRLYSLLRTFPADQQREALETYRVCLEDGCLFERLDDDEPCVYTLHSLVADHLIRVSATTPAETDDQLIQLVRWMSTNPRDLDIIRRILKRVTDYEINLSSEERTTEMFEVAAQATGNDWVVCQQFAKYLVRRDEHEAAYAWSERALEANPDHAPLHHTRGNVLRHWGIQLRKLGQQDEANRKFILARRAFATSRIRREPDEYGYVSHLDMILYLMRNEDDEVKRASLLSEGVQLYREGVRAVSEERFNLLLEERFRQAFDLDGATTEALCVNLELAVERNLASPYAATFLADQVYRRGDHDKALAIVRRYRDFNPEGVIAWAKEAELQARLGRYADAGRCLDSARRREQHAETSEATYRLLYWDVVVSTILEDYQSARAAAIRLSDGAFARRSNFPTGYVWKEPARNIDPHDRSFREHAKIWSGRVENLRAGMKFGEIALVNSAGDTFYVHFNPRYFTRRDIRRGQFLNFVMTILPNGLRADDVESKPFVDTADDLFVP